MARDEDGDGVDDGDAADEQLGRMAKRGVQRGVQRGGHRKAAGAKEKKGGTANTSKRTHTNTETKGGCTPTGEPGLVRRPVNDVTSSPREQSFGRRATAGDRGTWPKEQATVMVEGIVAHEWTCEFCHTAVFDTCAECEVHEDMCKANLCSMNAVVEAAAVGNAVVEEEEEEQEEVFVVGGGKGKVAGEGGGEEGVITCTTCGGSVPISNVSHHRCKTEATEEEPKKEQGVEQVLSD